MHVLVVNQHLRFTCDVMTQRQLSISFYEFIYRRVLFAVHFYRSIL